MNNVKKKLHFSYVSASLMRDIYSCSIVEQRKTHLVRLRRVGIGEKDVIAVQCDLDNMINFGNINDVIKIAWDKDFDYDQNCARRGQIC